jgi:hypothetical protein
MNYRKGLKPLSTVRESCREAINYIRHRSQSHQRHFNLNELSKPAQKVKWITSRHHCAWASYACPRASIRQMRLLTHP